MSNMNPNYGDNRIRVGVGIGVIALACLLALGLWSNGAAGSFGAFMDRTIRWSFGYMGLFVPIVLGLFGAIQFLERVEDIELRIYSGALSLLIGLSTFIHLFTNMPGRGAGVDVLRHSGGVIGASAALPLVSWFSTPGAGLLAFLLSGAGVMMLANISLDTISIAVRQTIRFLADQTNKGLEKRAQYKAAKRERDLAFQAQQQALEDELPADPNAEYVNDYDHQNYSADSGNREDDYEVDYENGEERFDQTPSLGSKLKKVAENVGSTLKREPDLSIPSFIPQVEDDFVVDFAEEEPAEPAISAYIHNENDDEHSVEKTLIGDPYSQTTVQPNALRAPSQPPLSQNNSGAQNIGEPTRAMDTDEDGTLQPSASVEVDEVILSQIQGDLDEIDAERLELEGNDEDDLAKKLVPRESKDYVLPSVRMLNRGHGAPDNLEDLNNKQSALTQMFDEFGVDARVVGVRRGPTVTRFEIELGVGVKVNAITKLDRDIAYALATSDVRIVAPIPGKVAIGIEVPNSERDFITLGDILTSEVAENMNHPLSVALGVDIGGRPVMINLAKMPHVLVAGATGAGKSVVVNGMVTSLIMRNTPEQVRIILVDPKQVEMAIYEDVPHLLTRVVTEPKRAKDALDWLVNEMERRYGLLRNEKVRHLDTYNEKVPDEEFLPYIVCVIDELADLMMVAKNDVETAIVRIAQKARAVGIHLVIATQRPSVNVVTGLIKANVPSRIALSMATGHDSKTILDQYGAEKLIGMGDMLYMPGDVSKPHRIQGSYVDEKEIEKIVEFCKAQKPVVYEKNVIKEGKEAIFADIKGEDASDDDLVKAAMELVVRSGLGSTSMLQRKLQLGFARAGRIMDELENMGVVGPSEGPKARNVLMTVEELEAEYSES